MRRPKNPKCGLCRWNPYGPVVRNGAIVWESWEDDSVRSYAGWRLDVNPACEKHEGERQKHLALCKQHGAQAGPPDVPLPEPVTVRGEVAK